mgnify:FL=1|tara:strand:- start:440 stop:805 length:366 start_codon:yes stop_codon:yes gene_type:complete
MTLLTILINLIIALTLLNVWILRLNKKTIYRGGDANSMKEEFDVYGLPLWFMYFIGFSKIMLAFLLIIGIWIYQLNFYSYIILSALMIGAIVMHFKVKDPIIKSIPAISVLMLLLALLGIV